MEESTSLPYMRREVRNGGSSSVYEPMTLTSDVKQRKQRSQHNRPNPNNGYKTKKNFTGFYTEVNPKWQHILALKSLEAQ